MTRLKFVVNDEVGREVTKEQTVHEPGRPCVCVQTRPMEVPMCGCPRELFYIILARTDSTLPSE